MDIINEIADSLDGRLFFEAEDDVALPNFYYQLFEKLTELLNPYLPPGITVQPYVRGVGAGSMTMAAKRIYFAQVVNPAAPNKPIAIGLDSAQQLVATGLGTFKTWRDLGTALIPAVKRLDNYTTRQSTHQATTRERYQNLVNELKAIWDSHGWPFDAVGQGAAIQVGGDTEWETFTIPPPPKQPKVPEPELGPEDELPSEADFSGADHTGEIDIILQMSTRPSSLRGLINIRIVSAGEEQKFLTGRRTSGSILTIDQFLDLVSKFRSGEIMQRTYPGMLPIVANALNRAFGPPPAQIQEAREDAYPSNELFADIASQVQAQLMPYIRHLEGVRVNTTPRFRGFKLQIARLDHPNELIQPLYLMAEQNHQAELGEESISYTISIRGGGPDETGVVSSSWRTIGPLQTVVAIKQTIEMWYNMSPSKWALRQSRARQ